MKTMSALLFTKTNSTQTHLKFDDDRQAIKMFNKLLKKAERYNGCMVIMTEMEYEHCNEGRMLKRPEYYSPDNTWRGSGIYDNEMIGLVFVTNDLVVVDEHDGEKMELILGDTPLPTGSTDANAMIFN